MLRINTAACKFAVDRSSWRTLSSRRPSSFIFPLSRCPISRVSQYRLNSTKPVKNHPQDSNIKPISPPINNKTPKETTGSSQVSSKSPIASLLKDIYTIPNMLTMSRIASTPFIGYFLASGNSTVAISLFAYLCVTDFLDGYIARRYNLKSVLGSILDPLADKFLMTTCTAALCIGGDMPLYVGGIIIGRDVMLSFMAFFMRYQSLPAPKTVRRYFDPKVTTHTVLPNTLGKVNTALQMFYIGGLVLLPGLEQVVGLPWETIFSWYGMGVAATTFVSGASYVLNRGSAKIPVK